MYSCAFSFSLSTHKKRGGLLSYKITTLTYTSTESVEARGQAELNLDAINLSVPATIPPRPSLLEKRFHRNFSKTLQLSQNKET